MGTCAGCEFRGTEACQLCGGAWVDVQDTAEDHDLHIDCEKEWAKWEESRITFIKDSTLDEDIPF